MGAPSALQIADRWHLIQNLAAALDPVVRRLGRSLRPPKNTQGKKEQEKLFSTSELRLTPVQQRRREQVHEQFRLVESLYLQRHSLREIAAMVQIDKNTLRKQVEILPAWKDRAASSSVRELAQFSQGIGRDRAAVEAALSRPESNGRA